MLGIHFLEKNRQFVKKKLLDKYCEHASKTVNKILDLNQKRKNTQQIVDNLRQKINNATREIATMVQSLKNGMVSEDIVEEASAVLSKNDVVKQQDLNNQKLAAIFTFITQKKAEVKKTTIKLKHYESELENLLLTLPNLAEDDVPIGENSSHNQIVSTCSQSRKNNQPLPHWDIIKKYDIIDFELGNKITGAGFPVYKDKGARLQRALINFFIDQAVQQGYQETLVPILVNQASVIGTGNFPDKEEMMYRLAGNNMFLIPTAEVPLTNLYRGRLLHTKDLPIKLVGYTPCFRREAGSWGRHVRGLNRLHQFDKVEIVQIVEPSRARDTLKKMCDFVERLLQQLELTYRVVKLCTGDLSFSSAITYDLEVWAAGQKQWLEVSSVSCFNDFQAQRMQIRYKDKQKIRYCYTLNGSALALPRVTAAILESYCTEDHINIPKVLRGYTGFDKI